jgi:hypothetical protein
MVQECVQLVNIPHAGAQLNETTITKSEGQDDVRGGDIAGAQVNETEDESGEGESAQPQRSWVAELAVLDRTVKTGLELTTEGGKARRATGDMGERTIAKASGRGSDLVLLTRHLGGQRRAGVVGVVVVGDIGDGSDILLLSESVCWLFGRHLCDVGSFFSFTFLEVYYPSSFAGSLCGNESTFSGRWEKRVLMKGKQATAFSRIDWK